MSEITPTDHDPSPIAHHGSCCYPARGEYPARLSHYKFLVTIIIGQCIITSTSPQCSLFYMPAVLFVLLKHRLQNSSSCSHNSWPQSTRSPGSRARCAFYLRANSRCARSCCSYNSLNRFPAPNYCTLPTRFRSVVTRLVSINQATRCLSLFCWAPTSGV
mgnify:CR=1 FL=1